MRCSTQTAGASLDLSLLLCLWIAVPLLLPAGKALAYRLLAIDLAAMFLFRLLCLRCMQQGKHQL